MIYLDVTSACHSALNTGVKRIQRGMHASLRGVPDYVPVCWQSARRHYRRLEAPDFARLEGPQAPRGLGLFDSFAPGFFADRLHYFRDGNLIPPWSDSTGGTLLVPDLIWDNRGRFLAETKKPSLRRIGVFHDAIALRRPGQSRIDRYFCRRGIHALARLDGVLCISYEAEADLLHFWQKDGIRPAPTRVAPWPVPFTDARPVHAPNFQNRRLLYVARLEPHKNHLRLLEACEILWREGLSFELRLIGCLAYPFASSQILRRIQALRRVDRPIRWQAHVAEEELHVAYRESSFTVFPSLLEGFGLPILESLWHGRPVVCGTAGAIGEVARDGGCLTVDPEQTNSLADGLRSLLTDESKYTALYAQTQARPFRTWPDYWNEIANFIR